MAVPVTNPAPKGRTRWGLLSDAPLLALALALLVLYFARVLFIPLAIALTLNFLLAPVVMEIERARVRRLPAVLLVMVISFTIVGAGGWIVARQVIAVINDLPNYRENIHAKFASLHGPSTGPLSRTVTSIREIGQEIANETNPTPPPKTEEQPLTRREREEARIQAEKEAERQPVPVTVVQPRQTTGEYLSQFARPALEPIGMLTMVVIFTFYMLLKREDLRNRMLLLAGMGQLNLMTQALNEAAARISRYLITNVLVNAAYGVIFGIGLYLLHVPNATLWGALMGILRMIPFVGTMIAGFSTVAFTLAVFNNWSHALWVLLLFGGLEFVVANFIEPLIYGKRTGISAFALVLMAIVWTLLWGWPGLIVSTPLTVCLIVMGRYIPQMSFLHILLGDDAELSPEAHFYERLLAMDQPEAHQIAMRFLEGHNLADLYDDVVLPSLVLSEQDRHKGVLDDVHSDWLYQSATELVAELTDYQSPEPMCGASGHAPLPADVETAPEPTSPVVCVAADDQADEIAGTMLAQLLEHCGHRTLLLSTTALSTEIMERLAEDPSTILFISAVPPFAFAQARRLTQSLRKSLPRNPIVVGLWGGEADIDTLRERFGHARPDAIVTSLGDGLSRVREIDGKSAERRTKAPEPGYTVF
jgi:predicted PurR-regulated permease PerM